MNVYDIKIQNYDLAIANGDFIITESEQQESDLIINTFTGNWFEYPLVGVGILNFLASQFTSPLPLENLIVSQLKADGFIVDKVSVAGSTIKDIAVSLEAHR